MSPRCGSPRTSLGHFSAGVVRYFLLIPCVASSYFPHVASRGVRCYMRGLPTVPSFCSPLTSLRRGARRECLAARTRACEAYKTCGSLLSARLVYLCAVAPEPFASCPPTGHPPDRTPNPADVLCHRLCFLRGCRKGLVEEF